MADGYQLSPNFIQRIMRAIRWVESQIPRGERGQESPGLVPQPPFRYGKPDSEITGTGTVSVWTKTSGSFADSGENLTDVALCPMITTAAAGKWVRLEWYGDYNGGAGQWHITAIEC